MNYAISKEALHNASQNLSSYSNIPQCDGNISLSSSFDDDNCTVPLYIPVVISQSRQKSEVIRRLPPVRKTLRRNNMILQSVELPVVINLNPRSIYNKTEDFRLILEQYSADCLTISESWERDNLSLSELLDLENYQIFSNVKQRDFKGGKPAIVINTEKYNAKPLCPDVITVPVGVEAVWVLISPKIRNPKNRIRNIAVCSVYYRGPKSTKKKELFDHLAESYNILVTKYGSDLQFLIAGDTNRLNLSPILALSPNLKQVVKVPTRLKPEAILDPIITSMWKYYSEPVTKPPLQNDPNNGKPSDHLLVLMRPLASTLECPPRQYSTVQYRPLTDSGVEQYGRWLADQTWGSIYAELDCHRKTEKFQDILVQKFYKVFPLKSMKVAPDDKPWFTKSLKLLDRRRKREFYKNYKSHKWEKLNDEFLEKCESEKASYYHNIVHDLKISNPGQWYSKVKRMTGQDTRNQEITSITELEGLESSQQVEIIADHYSKVSNLYQPVKKEHFEEYLKQHSKEKPPNIGPYKVYRTIKKMNKNSATIPGDLPMKIISKFADDLTLPLCHIINCCIQAGQYPKIWKTEIVTPVPKVHPPEKLDHLRKISGLMNFSKISDCILTQYLVEDMAPAADKSQYGNVQGVSVQHYLIKMLHEILLNLDSSSQSQSFAVIMSMIDWSKAFDYQSHILGIQSFIDNGVRPSLIPILLSFFQDRKMKVKWNRGLSESRNLPGGGPQGGILGILEYKSQSNNNTDFLNEKEKFKYIDDLSILEVINLILAGISSYNVRQQVPSDIKIGNKFLHSKDIQTQGYLDRISEWTQEKEMKLNCNKSNYMIFNFSKLHQFNLRLHLENTLLSQVKETCLLGVKITDDLKWHTNTASLVARCYKRMTILRNLSSFYVPIIEMINIYCLYIRSVAEQSCVVWFSAITTGEENDLERIQKVALRIILKENYITYESALNITNLETLKARRSRLAKKFAIKCTKNEKTKDMFPLKSNVIDTRNSEKYEVTRAKTNRLAVSSIPTMQKMLNKMKQR